MNTQQPLGSGFDAYSTAHDVIQGIDLTGRVAIVTGGHSTLGLETARVLAAAGAEVVIPARDIGRAAQVLDQVPGSRLEPMDLMDPASIDAFASRFVARGRALDILVNSAGIMATPLARDEQGNESQFSTNHLGHFRLTRRLLPALRQARGARVVSVSSRGHQISGIDFDDVNFDRRAYDKWIAYGQSKTANVLFAVALDARGKGDGIRAFSLHPGQILGPLARHLSEAEIEAFGVRNPDGSPIIAPDRGMKTVAQGAATAVWCATSPLLEGVGGLYCEDCEVASIMADGVGQRGVAAYAIDPDVAERLWSLSERMTAHDGSRAPSDAARAGNATGRSL